MKKIIRVLVFLFVLALAYTSQAGTQLTGLMGGDVTDPGNKIQATGSYISEADWEARYADATWVSIQSYKKGPFESNECPANLFNNVVGGGTAKWYDSFGPNMTTPAYVTLQFPEAFVLTHFTLTSGNDSMNSRNPKDWGLYGSNDGLNWTPIYHTTTTADFTETINTTVLYSSFTYADGNITSATQLNDAQKAAVSASLGSGTTISTPDFSTPGAYSWYKLQVNTTSSNGATQLGELELFGNKVTSGRTSGNPLLPVAQLMNHVGSVYSLDAQNTATLTVDENNKVSAWADSNSNGFEFTQTTADFRPTMSTISINGKEFNALEFTKETQTTENPYGGQLLTTNKEVNAQTVFILAQNDINHGLTAIWGQTGDYGIRLNGSNGLWQDVGGNTNDFISTNGNYYYNGTPKSEFSGVLQNNLVLTQAARNAPYPITSNNAVGSYFTISVGSRGYDGKILEVVVYDHALTDYETKIVNTGFALKYGMEIANTLDVFPGSIMETAYKNDLIGLMNRTIDGKAYFQDCSGEGGLGIYGKILGSKPAEYAYDIFGLATYQAPSEGTEIYAVSNIPAGTDAGILTNIAGIKGSTYDKWAKEWYFTNKSEGMQDWEITLEFNAEDAHFTDFDSYTDSEWYLISKTEEDGPYFRVGDLDPQVFSDKMISFILPASLLQTGYYTLGVMTSPEVPEPAAWVMILIGLAGIGVVRKRLLHPGT